MGENALETALVVRAQAGDPKALSELLRLWGPRVRRFAGRLCPATEVLDVAQETLLVLATKIGSLRSAQAAVSWSFQIVKRQCIRAFSHIRRETAIVHDLGVINPTYSLPNHEQAWLLGQLAMNMESLPLRDREILLARDIEGLSLRETARRLNLGLAAAKSRLHRARRELRQRMVRATG